jgi:hypothetical protein
MSLTPAILSLIKRSFENFAAVGSGRFHYSSETIDPQEKANSESHDLVFDWAAGRIAGVDDIVEDGEPDHLEFRLFADEAIGYYLFGDEENPQSHEALWEKRALDNKAIGKLRLSMATLTKQTENFLALLTSPGATSSLEPAGPGRLVVRVNIPSSNLPVPRKPGEAPVNEDLEIRCRLEIDLERELPVSVELLSSSPAYDFSYQLRFAFYGLGHPVDIERPDPADCLAELPPVPGTIRRIEIEATPDLREVRLAIAGATALARLPADAFELEPMPGERVLISGHWQNSEQQTFVRAPFVLGTMLALDGSSYYDADPSADERDEQGRLTDSVCAEAVFEASCEARGKALLILALADGSPFWALPLDWWQPLPVEGEQVIISRRWYEGNPRPEEAKRPDGTVVASFRSD